MAFEGDASSSANAMPGVRSAASLVDLRSWEVATEGRCPPAGGGSAAEELQRRWRELWAAMTMRVGDLPEMKIGILWRTWWYAYRKDQGRINLPHSAFMENDASFIAPEGVYTVIDDHKPPPNLTILGGPAQYPTKLSTVLVRFPPPKQGGAPGFAQLLGGGNKDSKKEKTAHLNQPSTSKEREDGVSLSSSDTPEEIDQTTSTQEHPPTTPVVAQETRSLFSNPSAGKRKHDSHPKGNMRTTSSTFISRVQTSEGLAKTLQSKQGDATFLFYNISKTCVWIETGSKAKVTSSLQGCYQFDLILHRTHCPESPSLRIPHATTSTPALHLPTI